MSDTTSVPALARNAIVGQPDGPPAGQHARARYLRAVESLESIVYRLVTKATTPPGLTWSRALGKEIVVDGETEVVVGLCR